VELTSWQKRIAFVAIATFAVGVVRCAIHEARREAREERGRAVATPTELQPGRPMPLEPGAEARYEERPRSAPGGWICLLGLASLVVSAGSWWLYRRGTFLVRRDDSAEEAMKDELLMQRVRLAIEDAKAKKAAEEATNAPPDVPPS
jgi:hypothetical protein